MAGLLAKKIALITGAAQGIGKAIAQRYADEGADIIIADLLYDKAYQVAKDLEKKGGKVLAVKADISLAADVDRLFSIIREEFGRLDLLVNNAGILIRGSIMETTEETWDKIMNTNLKGAFLCSKAAAAMMIPNGGGKIINITSIDGEVVYYHGRHAAYGVSKAGLVMLTKAMAVELAPYKINVNAIAPGVVKTEISAKSMSNRAHMEEVLREIPLGKMAEPEEIAGAAAFLASEDAGYITGAVLMVDGGWVIH